MNESEPGCCFHHGKPRRRQRSTCHRRCAGMQTNPCITGTSPNVGFVTVSTVFPLTNHIDHPWTHNPEVVWLATSRILRRRSVTSLSPLKADGPGWSCPLACGRTSPARRYVISGHTHISDAASMEHHALHAPFGDSSRRPRLRGGLSSLRLGHTRSCPRKLFCHTRCPLATSARAA